MTQTPTPYVAEYTRIEAFLPFKKIQEIVAGRNVFSHLQTARISRVRRRYQGYTHSSELPPIFRGFWWDPQRRQWVADQIVVVMLDIDVPFSDRSRVTAEATDIKRIVSSLYRQAGAPQKEIWVTATPIVRAH